MSQQTQTTRLNNLVLLLALTRRFGWFVAPTLSWVLAAGDAGVTAEALVEAIGDESEVRDALAMLRSVLVRHGDKFYVYIDTDVHRYIDTLFKLDICAQIKLANGPGLTPPQADTLAKGQGQDERTNTYYSYLPSSSSYSYRDNTSASQKDAVCPQKHESLPATLASCCNSPLHLPPERNGIYAFIEMVNEDSRRINSAGKGNRYLHAPSTYPILNCWKSEDPNRWKATDWIGYWLHLFLEYYGEEDPVFRGQRCHRPRTKTDIYWETGFQAIKLRDSDRGFRGDASGLKEYLDWIFNDFLPNATWMNSAVLASQVFKIKNNKFLERFKTRSIKVNGKSTKQGTWHPWGYVDA